MDIEGQTFEHWGALENPRGAASDACRRLPCIGALTIECCWWASFRYTEYVLTDEA